MPELPEVEHLRRSLEPMLLGRRVIAASLLRRDMCQSFSARGVAKARTTGASLLAGAAISKLLRHGKQLAIVADSGAVLLVHLGMTGRLVAHERDEALPSHTHARWTIETNSSRLSLLFIDPRRFGGLWTYPSLGALHEHRWSRLGPDALTIRDADLRAKLRNSNRPIKASLLDQETVAGVGNIYADEALFEAKIAPTTIARTIKVDCVSTLAAALRLILSRSVLAGGSTLRNYVDASGQPGRAQDGHLVYGRAGEPCARCGGILRSGVVAQRTTVWCTACQPNSSNRSRGFSTNRA
jgi:formamidopyrimidine-DNA glycosylase